MCITLIDDNHEIRLMQWLALMTVTYYKSLWTLINIIYWGINNWQFYSFTLLVKWLIIIFEPIFRFYFWVPTQQSMWSYLIVSAGFYTLMKTFLFEPVWSLFCWHFCFKHLGAILKLQYTTRRPLIQPW